MTPFNRSWRLPLAALVLFAGLILPARGQEITAETKKAVLDSMTDVVTKRAFVPGVDFAKWPEFLEKHRTDIDKSTDSAGFIREVNRTLREFGISHINLRSPRAAVQRTQTSTIGLGLSTRVEESGGLAIIAVAPESPASEAGLAAGDVILEVNSTVAKDASALEGEEGKSVTLKVKKKDGETKDVTLQFKKFSRIRPATLTWIGEDAAVLKLPTFSTGYSRDNIEKLLAEAGTKAKTLVIDLRNNGGGAVNNMQHFLNLLIPANTDVGTFVRRQTLDDYIKANPSAPTGVADVAKWAPGKVKTRKLSQAPFEGKIAVLINRRSASASEITAAALQDVRGAKVIGVKSAGAVLASIYGKLAEGYELQFPVSDYVTIKGIRLEGTPVVPDIEGPKTEEGKDTWVEAAIKAFAEAKK